LDIKEGIVATPDTLEDAENVSTFSMSVFSIRHTNVELSKRIRKLVKDLEDLSRATRDIVAVVVRVDDEEAVGF
jgi:hypothetical protein